MPRPRRCRHGMRGRPRIYKEIRHRYNAAMDTLTFRSATPDDIPALIELVTSAYRGDASRVGWTTEADLLDGQRVDAAGLLADIQRPRSVILLAEQGGRLLACCHVADEDGHGYFGMFAVSPAAQGGG